MKITKKIDTRLKRLASLAGYGLEWVKSNDPIEDRAYIAGAVEAVGFQIACVLCQDILPGKPSTPASDVILELGLFDFPHARVIHKKLRRLVKAFEPQ